jgi:uncharacterized protein with NRDE domain
MCCLTIVKTETNKIVVTHNRDEQWSRQSNASQVQESIINGKKIWMPKDSLSGGTWIGTDGVRAAAILNGFKENHIRKPMYRASRGSIIPEFLCSDSTDDFISNFDPSGLEPFTLIFVDEDKKILELGWDENTFHFFDKSSDIPLIYSSATLYKAETRERRKSIFMSRIDNQIDSSDIWKFHENKGSDHGDFVNVDYNDEISTVAISQIVVADISVFHYQSLLNNNIKQSIVLEQ